MKFILNEEDIEIVEPVVRDDDKGLVHLPTNTGKTVPRYTEIQKEIIANDILDGMTGKDAAKLHGVSQPLANSYARGEGIDGDARARIISKRYDIQDMAVSKLMDTLNLIEPERSMKMKDKVQLMTGLASVVDKMAERGPAISNKVELHLYAPNQKKETDYDIIEVG